MRHLDSYVYRNESLYPSGSYIENMFNESWPWKRDLYAAADRLEKARLGLPEILNQVEAGNTDEEDAYIIETEATYEVERDVMYGAFAVRRLIGMPSKVTKQTRESKATVANFPLRVGAKAPDISDAFGNLDMYDFQIPVNTVINVNKLCDLFVHSFVLFFLYAPQGLSVNNWECLDENDSETEQKPTELAGWLVSSDKSSKHHLTFVPLPELVRVMRNFAVDDVTQVTGHRDKKGRMHYTASKPRKVNI